MKNTWIDFNKIKPPCLQTVLFYLNLSTLEEMAKTKIIMGVYVEIPEKRLITWQVPQLLWLYGPPSLRTILSRTFISEMGAIGYCTHWMALPEPPEEEQSGIIENCPFCNTQPTVHYKAGVEGCFIAECRKGYPNCGLNRGFYFGNSTEEAVKIWNEKINFARNNLAVSSRENGGYIKFRGD